MPLATHHIQGTCQPCDIAADHGLDHFLRFLPISYSTPFPAALEGGGPAQPTPEAGVLLPSPRERSTCTNHMEFFCVGGQPILPHFPIHSCVYQYGLTDRDFILGLGPNAPFFVLLLT